MSRPPEQAYLDVEGVKPPDEPDVEEVKSAIYLWLDAKVEQKRAGENTKLKHTEMLASLAAAGLDWHPYIDPSSGKRRRLWLKRDSKAATSGIPKPPSEGKKKRRGGPRRDADAELPGDVTDNVVEMRRVPRSTVEKEIDGFGSVRERMEAKEAEKAKKGKRK